MDASFLLKIQFYWITGLIRMADVSKYVNFFPSYAPVGIDQRSIFIGTYFAKYFFFVQEGSRNRKFTKERHREKTQS